jgi:GDP-L-fucose synthase
MPRKLVDASRMKALGWQPSTPLEAGLETTYRWLVERLSSRAPVRGWPTEVTPARG